jgi:hypothetical protein
MFPKSNTVSHLEGGSLKRRLTDQEGVHHTAQCPHIGGEAVALLVQHLGRDVVRGPADGPAKAEFSKAENIPI